MGRWADGIAAAAAAAAAAASSSPWRRRHHVQEVVVVVVVPLSGSDSRYVVSPHLTTYKGIENKNEVLCISKNFHRRRRRRWTKEPTRTKKLSLLDQPPACIIIC
jgi:hypothetical protein